MWETNPLSALCDVLDSRRKPITKKDRSPGPYPYYGATGILDYVEGYLFDEKLVLIGEDGAKWGAGDNSAFSIDGKTWVNNHAHVIRPKRNKVLDKWLIYYLNGEDLSDFITGMTVPKLNQGKLREIPIPLPPIPEQQRIVVILDQAFADIEKARANAEKNLKNARELFDSYLNQVFSQRGEGWVESELFDHVKFIDYRGKTPKKTQEGLRLITAKNVRMGYLKKTPEEFVAAESYDEWMTRGIPEKGDILFTTEAPLANVAQLDTSEKVVFAQRIITMQPNRSVLDDAFLKYLLMSQPVQERILKKGTGATVTGIKASLLKKIIIEYPFQLSEQRRYVNTLDVLDRKVNQLEVVFSKKLESLDELKKSLLHQAFSGELTKTEGMVA